MRERDRERERGGGGGLGEREVQANKQKTTTTVLTTTTSHQIYIIQTNPCTFSYSPSTSFAGPLTRFFRLLDNMIPLGPNERWALAWTENGFRQICESLQRLNATGRLDAIFETASFNNLVRAALDLPEVVEIVIDSFLREDLHEFLVENQLGEVISDFPAAFCGDDHIWRYFNQTARTTHFRNTLCALNLEQLAMDYNTEFVEYEGGVLHIMRGSAHPSLGPSIHLFIHLNKTAKSSNLKLV